MTVEEFEIALDTHGPDFADWPEDRVAGARALITQSEAAREALRAAEELDLQLSSLLQAPVRAPAGLSSRILAEALPEPQPSGADVIPFPTRSVPPTPENQVAVPGRHGWLMAAAVLIVCFLGGFASVQTVFPDGSDGQFSYQIAAIYGGLAE